jgi:RNA polymerase sigma factor (TIGR02999 family)
MADVTRILTQIESGDPAAAEELLPLVYDELRKLAAAKLAQEKPGQTLQATALVHEAYLRLVGKSAASSQESQASQSVAQANATPGASLTTPAFDSRGHFFAAAAEAMRRILVDNARRRASVKRGGDRVREDINPDELSPLSRRDPLEVMAVHDALDRLGQKSPRKAELVKLRYFLGCTVAEAAEILGIAAATAEEDWSYARAWLRREWLRGHGD